MHMSSHATPSCTHHVSLSHKKQIIRLVKMEQYIRWKHAGEKEDIITLQLRLLDIYH